MYKKQGRILGAGIAAAAMLAAALAAPSAIAGERAPFIAIGAAARAPIGWIEF